MENSEPLEFAAVDDCTRLTIRAVIDGYAAEDPRKVFAVFPDTDSQITWGELQHTARQLSRYLNKQGFAPGARIGMLRANGQAALELFLGAMYGGYTIATFNPVAGESALRYVFERHLLSPFLLRLEFCADLLSIHQQLCHQSLLSKDKEFLPFPLRRILYDLDIVLTQQLLSCPYHKEFLKF